MPKPTPWMPRLLTATALGLAACPAAGQMEALRNSDDQFIQGLREQGMSDLLERFVENEPPSDPIARLALDVALKEFIANDLLARAGEANRRGEFTLANDLFLQSRDAFGQVLDAQRKLVRDHRDDERLPLWQTDLAQMLLYRYLPTYYQDAYWHYEFGLPSDEQKQAYESAVVEALVATTDAADRLDDLTSRASADAQLRPRLEGMGVWYKLEDYRSINTPYWLAQAAHGVALMPGGHAYYRDGDRVRNQKADAAEEKQRLRNLALDALSGRLITDDQTELTAKLYSGRTLVRSNNIDDVDEGVETFLEPVIAESPDSVEGYLATLGKAVGRKNAGELDVALEILGGMDRHPYVRADEYTTSRLLAADLMFRMLNEQAQQAPAEQRPAKVARAYERAYVVLIDADADPRFRQQLFARWADSVGDDADPAALPPAVRMGIGEQLTQQGGYQAQLVVQAMGEPPSAIRSEARQRLSDLEQQRDQAKAMLERAAAFNESLTGDDMDGPVLARGLFNLGMNRYWLAELQRVFNNNQADASKYVEAAGLWLELARRVPNDAQAQEALVYAIGLVQGQDAAFNLDSVTKPRVREVYQGAFELLNERWSQNEVTQNNRVYAGFHLYEKAGAYEKAADVYRALPSSHKDYYEARRQLIYAQQRGYRGLADRRRLLEASEPQAADPGNATTEQLQARREWERQRDALQEEIDRRRGDIVEEAELIILDAEEELAGNADAGRQFTAATALGAATVVLAGMEADAGNADQAAELLAGFETTYGVDGPYGRLADQQADPAAAKSNLRGLVQSAQQQRILALLDAGQSEAMVDQAKVMMDGSPDVAAAVVSGVLQRIRATIEREERAKREAAFELQRQDAEANIRFQAENAVELGKLLVDWAKQRDFTPQQMVAYQLPLAEALMLAGRGRDALQIMQPIAERFPNNFDIAIKAGKAHLAVYREAGKQIENFNGAMQQFSKVITYYNQRPEKPDKFWDAWLQVCYLLEAAGGDQAEQIPSRARILLRVDENLGGPQFKDRFMDVFDRNGGVERLPKQ